MALTERYQSFTVASALLHHATADPERSFLVFRDEVFSCGRIESQAEALAAALHGLGIEAGDRVALLLPAWPEFVISMFAETNRLPFDLPECETELVGGYHTEYSSMRFALFFMGEYAAMIVGSGVTVTLFLGGWSLPFGWDSFLPSQTWWVGLLHTLVFFTKVIAFLLSPRSSYLTGALINVDGGTDF